MNKTYPQEAEHITYREYGIRWFQLLLFIFALISNIMFGFSLSTIVKQMSILYDVNIKWLQFLSISFSIFSVIMIIPGNLLNEKYGIRTTIQIGCILTLLGSIFALMVNVSFWFFFFGQLFSLVGFPFRLISASKFVANWFFPENRITIMVIIALLFNASSGIAIRIPLITVGEIDTSNIDNGRFQIQILMVILFVLMVIFCIPPIIFFKSRPLTPPSYSASDSCAREDYREAGSILKDNKDFRLLTISFALILGTITLFTLQMESFVAPFGFSMADQSNAVGLGVIAGLIGDLTVGTAIKKTQSYKLVLRICNFLSTVLFFLLIIALYVNKTFFFVVYFLLCGCSAIMALSFEFACELSFPMNENTTIALFGFFGNMVNVLQGVPEVLILSGNNKANSLIAMLFMLCLIGSANYLTYNIEENLKRNQKDQEYDARSETDISLLTT